MAIEPLFRYRVTWRRVGDLDSFNHEVAAAGADQAQRASVAEIQQSLGPNSTLWEPELVVPLHPLGPSVVSTFQRLRAQLRSLFHRAPRPAPGEHEPCRSREGDSAP